MGTKSRDFAQHPRIGQDFVLEKTSGSGATNANLRLLVFCNSRRWTRNDRTFHFEKVIIEYLIQPLESLV